MIGYIYPGVAREALFFPNPPELFFYTRYLIKQRKEKELKLRHAKRIDFTESLEDFEAFPEFSQEVTDYIRVKDKAELAIIVDRGYGFKTQAVHLVADHINLSGHNPLVGPNDENGPRFPVVNHVYLCAADLINQEETWSIGNPLEKLPTGIAAGIKPGVKLNSQEWEHLTQLGANFYCHNLVQSMLVAAHKGLPVVGLVVPEGETVSDKILMCLVR